MENDVHTIKLLLEFLIGCLLGLPIGYLAATRKR